MVGREGETRGDGDASSSKMADPESPRGIHSIPGTADATWSSSLEFSPVKSGPMSDLSEMYEVGRAVGKGGYAVVYKGTRRSDGATVAIKQVDLHEMSERKRLRCLREVQLLGNLRHPGIVEMHDSFLDETKLCIVFEWAAGGDLKRFLRKNLAKGILLDEQTVWRTFRQIADAVTHMHERRVMHRDIKPANVLVTQDGRCKVADLGLGRQFSENTIAVDAKVGTPYYVSPEVVKGDPYDWSSDVWSLGCLLYELCTLRSPFEMQGANLHAVFRRITDSSWEPLPGHRFSNPLVSLVREMMDPNPRARPSSNEVSRRCKEAVDAFDAIERRGSTTRGTDGAAEALSDALILLTAEAVRFRPEFRPRKPALEALRACVTPAAFLAALPGDTHGAGFSRVIRIGSWLMKLLGRKGLALESELHAIETETETVSETVIDDTNVRREDTETTEGDDGFIDSALLDAGGASGDSRDDGDAASGGVTVSGKDGKKSRSDPPPPLSALQSEAFTEPTATDARRHVIATEFLKECACFGVDVRYMCAHAVVVGRGWAPTECLFRLVHAALKHLDVRPRRAETRVPEADPDAVPEEIDGIGDDAWDAGGEGADLGADSDEDEDDEGRYSDDDFYAAVDGEEALHASTRAPIEPSVDPHAWRAEATRLGPALGSIHSHDHSTRLHAVRKASKFLEGAKEVLRVQLHERVVGDVRRDLRDIDARESFMLERLPDHTTRAYVDAREALDAAAEARGVAEARVDRAAVMLAGLDDAAEETRAEADDAEGGAGAGVEMCGTMRATMERMDAEMRTMDVRIELARHRLRHLAKTRAPPRLGWKRAD